MKRHYKNDQFLRRLCKTVLLPDFVIIVTLKFSRPAAGGLALNYDKISGFAKSSLEVIHYKMNLDL